MRRDTYKAAQQLLLFNHFFSKFLAQNPEFISLLCLEGFDENECFTFYNNLQADGAITYEEFKHMFLFFIKITFDNTFLEHKEKLRMYARQELIKESLI